MKKPSLKKNEGIPPNQLKPNENSIFAISGSKIMEDFELQKINEEIF